MTLPALNFPPAPVVGQLYPDPPVTGQPQYMWNGTMWLASKAAITQSIRLDALGYSGMQINGSMEVSQERGQTGVSTLGSYVVDGWVFSGAGAHAVTWLQQSTAVNNPLPFRNYIMNTVQTPLAGPAGGDYHALMHRIEGYRIARLNWGSNKAQPITIGFWTGHTRTGLYSVSVRNPPAYDRSKVLTYTQNVSGAWEYKTLTFSGSTDGAWNIDNNVGMLLTFCLAAGPTVTTASIDQWLAGNFIAATGQVNGIGATSDNFRITGVVVLPGIDAPTAAQSPLIMRPYDQELLACKRYYQINRYTTSQYVGSLQAVSGAQATGVLLTFPEMRAAPTASMLAGISLFTLQLAGGGGGGLNNVAAATSPTSFSGSFFNTGGLVAGNATALYANATASIAMDARL